MTVKEISRKELRQLKESYYTETHEVVSYEELANIEALVSDEEVFEHYACTNFVSDDFWR